MHSKYQIDGKSIDLDEPIKLDKKKKHVVEAVVDRLIVKPGIEARLADSLETALAFGNGKVRIDIGGKKERLFSEQYACAQCGIGYEEPAPRMFSFNSPYGAFYVYFISCHTLTFLCGTFFSFGPNP